MTDTPRIKILFLITKSNWGGAQRYVYDLSTKLSKEAFDVRVGFGGNGELKEKLEAAGIDAFSIDGITNEASISALVRATQNLIRLLKTEKPDILHVNSSLIGIAGSIAGKVCGIRTVIFTAHGWAFNEGRPAWQRMVLHILHWLTILLSDVTIAVSEAIKRQMRMPFVEHKIVVIRNGRTIEHFFERRPARQHLCNLFPQLEPFQYDFWSVTVAELHPVKQHDTTIRAMDRVIQAHPNVRHIIIGEGRERANLEALIRSLNLENHVFCVGAITEAAQFLKAFNLFILASRSEALGYVTLEASLAKLPIIASDVGGTSEIVRHESEALLFPAGDDDLLATYYLRLYADVALREKLAKNACERAQTFSFEEELKKTVELYRKSIRS